MEGEFSFPSLMETHVDNARKPLTAMSTVSDASLSANGVVKSAPKPVLPGRNKVALEKGYSQVDWLRLTKTESNLNGLSGKPIRRDITLEEVKQHNKPDDAWLVIRGMVYNVTPYLRFHPGGPEILIKVSGRDATSAFMKFHPWVNVGSLIEKCLVGHLAAPASEE